MPDLVAATIATPSFWPRATVLAESLARQHPEIQLFALLLGEREDFPELERTPLTPVFPQELRPALAPALLFRADEIALAAALKPRLLEHLDRRRGARAALWLDADTWVLAALDSFLAKLALRPLVATPFLSRPPHEPVVSPESLLRRAGILSAGMFALRFELGTREFLAFWRRQLERGCRNDPWLGLLYDQNWFDFALSFVDDAAIARDPSLHLGYWNVGEGVLARGERGWTLDGSPVRVLHASGFDPSSPARVTRHLAEADVARVAGLAPLLAEYAAAVAAAPAAADPPSESLSPRRFRGLEVAIAPCLRRYLSAVDPLGERFPEPFDGAADDGFFAFLVEPLALAGGVLNRAALALWESRTDLIHAFPDPGGADLAAYVAWLTQSGEGERAGLDPVFLAGLRVGAATAADGVAAPTREKPRAAPAELRDPARALLATWRLDDLGGPPPWLVEAVGVTPPGQSPLPRWAMLLHRVDPLLQRSFPDPVGADRRDFLTWLAAHEPATGAGPPAPEFGWAALLRQSG
ncbi:MAG: hypothetical protein U0X73_10140 [Thermoanaerobaculia bacterium]